MQNKNLLYTSSIVAALGGLLFGFDTAVISGANDALREVYNLTDATLGFTVSSALIGTILGAAFVGFPADKMGRKKVLLMTGLAYFVSAIGSGLAWDWYSFLGFRFLGGLGVGAASVISPMYIAEISPAKLRGRLVGLAQLNIVLGILFAFLSNQMLNNMDLGENTWRWMFAVEGVPAAAFFLLMFIAPLSPRWLMTKGREEEARQVLGRLGNDQARVDEIVGEIKESLEEDAKHVKVPFWTQPNMKPILMAFAIAAFNQLSGINAVLYYAPTIFKSAGAGENAALVQAVGLGAANLIFTVAALAVIDFFGRKKLMIIGSIGYIASLGACAWAFATQTIYNDAGDVTGFTDVGKWTVLISLCSFIASHAVGQGAVIWVFIGEIFPNSVRARGNSLGCFTHWIFAAVISLTFPMFVGAFGWGVFAFYAVCMVGQLVWVLTVMPETKGIPLEEIQKRMGIKPSHPGHA